MQYLLPKKSKNSPKITLVLDLDETLVHCTGEPTPNCEINLDVSLEGENYSIYGNARPNCLKFLEKCVDKFELVLFTASKKEYAEKILEKIDPKRRIKFRLI
jgi:CTD small phosphatase-like protein 2